jgi:hypothetical protein
LRSLGVVLALFLVLVMAGRATASERPVLELIERWLADEPRQEELDDLRRRAATGDARATFEVCVAYQTRPRNGAGPSEAIDADVVRPTRTRRSWCGRPGPIRHGSHLPRDFMSSHGT